MGRVSKATALGTVGCLFALLMQPILAQEIDKSCETTFIFEIETPLPTQNCLVGFQDFAFDATGHLWIADQFRIIRIPEHRLPLAEDTAADIVIGRPDFTTVERPGNANECSDELNKVCWLDGLKKLRFDNAGHLWVTHGAELARFSPPFRTAMAADFSLNRPGIGNLRRVEFLFDQGDNLWIVEIVRGDCSRIVRYPAPVQPDSIPDLVIGQAEHADVCPAPTPGPRQFHNVETIVFDQDGNLLVVDNRSSRILVFEPPFSDFMPASIAIGQKNLTDFQPLPFDQGGVFQVQDMEVDVFGQLWTLQSDSFVSVFSPPFTTGQDRSYWFDGHNKASGLPEWPFMGTGSRFKFEPDRSIRFFRGDGGWTARLEVPLLTSNGIVHAASFLPDPLAPGQIATAYGIQLGFDGGLAGIIENGELLTNLGKTVLLVNGIPAPLFFANDKQINFLVPWEISLDQEAKLEVVINGFRGPAVLVQVATVSPGVFVLPGDLPAVVNDEGKLEALKRGSYGVAFAAGLGMVQGDLKTGQVTPSDQLLEVQSEVQVTINGVPCNVLFAGLAPGFVGLYQINFEIPVDLPVAEVYLLIIQQEGIDSPAVRIQVI